MELILCNNTQENDDNNVKNLSGTSSQALRHCYILYNQVNVYTIICLR